MIGKASRTYVIALIFLLSAALYAESDEYILAYQVNPKLDEMFHSGMDFLEPLKNSIIKPAKEPSYISEKPLYFRILLANEQFFLVLDELKGTGKGYDTLYFDTNGNKDLTDDERITSTKEFYKTTFGPIMAFLGEGDEKSAYHFGFESSALGRNTPHYSIKPMCCYVGKAKFGPRMHRVMIADRNVNGFFNDKASLFQLYGADTILVDVDNDGEFAGGLDGREVFPLADYLLVDGKYYNPEVAREGFAVRFIEAKPVMGTCKVNHKEFSITLEGKRGKFHLAGDNYTVKVPAGKYELSSSHLKMKGAAGGIWEIRGKRSYKGLPEEIEVTPGKLAAFSFGPPFRAHLSYHKMGKSNSWIFTVELYGQYGEIYNTIRKDGKKAFEASVKIESEDGAYSTTVKAQKLFGEHELISWQPPSGKKGKFKAAPVVDAGPFKVTTGSVCEIVVE